MHNTLYIERDLDTKKITTESLLYEEPKAENTYGQPVFLNDEDYDKFIGNDIEGMKQVVDKTIQKANWGDMSAKYKS